MPQEFDDKGTMKVFLENMRMEVQKDGDDTYFGYALPGTALSAAKWRAEKYDVDGSRTFADGNSKFDNVATDLASLTYTT